jgi:hypothetical protein
MISVLRKAKAGKRNIAAQQSIEHPGADPGGSPLDPADPSTAA